MNYKKFSFFILLILIAIIALGSVSAADNQTFQDIQAQIDDAGYNGTVILNGTYYGNGSELSFEYTTIHFKGINNATLDARGLSGFFRIEESTFTFDNITFINGKYVVYDVFSIVGGSFSSISNCNFINNSGWNGGALTISNSNNVKLINCTFINNTAELGGACYIYQSIAQIDNSKFINNVIKYCNLGGGGAIYNKNAYGLTISNSYFDGNGIDSTYGFAPSIYNEGFLNLNNVTILNSFSNVLNSIDGSIFNLAGDLIITNSTIENLTAEGQEFIFLIEGMCVYGDLTYNNTDLPECYDLRNIDGNCYVTPIKDQGKAGTCWAFGSLASLESSLLLYYNESWDFSENNMKNLLSYLYPGGFDRAPNEGGGNSMVVAYLTRWSGPVNESDDPYDENGTYSPQNLSDSKHIQDIVFLPIFKNITSLKLAILNYGAVSYSLCGGMMEPSGNCSIMFLPENPDHIVSIIGWNDTYPGSAFGENIPDGAFIIKNSWGTNYTDENGTVRPKGDDGYYYMSYYDNALSRDMGCANLIFTSVESPDNYKTNYQYDPYGPICHIGFNNETAYFANEFTSIEDEKLAAFSIYTYGANSTYEVSVYVNGELRFIQNGTIDNPGYHTIKLDLPLVLLKDDLFRIEVNLTTPGCLAPIAIECPLKYRNITPTSEANQSFISKDGVEWIDLHENENVLYWRIGSKYVDYINNTNVCLKAFTTALDDHSFDYINELVHRAEDEDIILLDGYYFSEGNPITVETKEITFLGLNNATLDGKGISNIFDVFFADVSFYDINFINGNGTDGGAFNINYCLNVTINNCNFTNNSAENGGAISSVSSILDINNTLFKDNMAQDGGACYVVYSIAQIDNSQFINNTATSDTDFASGGALITSNNLILDIFNSIFLDNKVISPYGLAPAILNRGNLFLYNVTILNSTLNVTNNAEGVIYNTGGNLTIINSNIENLTKNGTQLFYIIVQMNFRGDLPYNNTNIPESYDLRNIDGTSYLTSVKDQGNGGNCWSFGSTGALESYLLRNYNISYDFSENHMKNLMANLYPEGYDDKPNDGGDNRRAVAYWARWSGPVNEVDDPYNATGNSSNEGLSPIYHVQDVIFLPITDDVDVLKLQLLNYGPISFILDAGNFKLNSSVPISVIPAMPNHMVLLVGWNDSYPGSNFGEDVPDGAFIFKNSWGVNHTYANGTTVLIGDEGYYYVSYYDLALSQSPYDTNMAIINVEDVNNYKTNYQYDPLGYTGGFGFNNETAYFANEFTSTEDEILAAFSLYTPAVNSTYESKIYVNGELKTTQSRTIDYPGYHTIKLENQVALSKDDLFRIEVKLNTPGCLYPVAVEAPFHNYSSKASSLPNQSFISKDGINWIDLYEPNPAVFFGSAELLGEYLNLNNTNVCLKAFTIPLTTPNINATVTDLGNGSYLISGTIQDENGNPITEGNLDIIVGNQIYSNVTINPDGTFNIIVSALNIPGTYDVTIKLTFNGQSFYNNVTITLEGAIVVNNTELPTNLKTSLNTGNPLMILLIALISIPLFKRKKF